MVIDTLAIVAILRQEPEASMFASALVEAEQRLLSAVSYTEASIVVGSRRGDPGLDDLRRLVRDAGLEIIPVDVGQAEAASRAYRRFGRGYHPARLNFGDCFAYALAMETGEPLLFKGDDFARTDVARCL